MNLRWAIVLMAAGLVTGSGCSAVCKSQCGDRCGDHGSQFAGMKYDCCCEHCGGGFGCGGGNGDRACPGGCDDCCDTCCGDTCDACACGDCGRCSGNSCGCQCNRGCFGKLCHKLCGCAGCGEFYWWEWRNDPPACCEPCDCHGNYTGGGEVGYYRAPYPVPDLAP